MKFKFSLFWAVFHLALCCSLLSRAQEPEEGIHIYAEQAKSYESLGSHSKEEETLEDVFSDQSRFNYWGHTSLQAQQSLFLDGVDQRFLHLSFNGFSLRDPSHPTGVFNVRHLTMLKGEDLILNQSQSLNLKTHYRQGSQFKIGGSSLGEGEVSGSSSHCGPGSCFKAQASVARRGGFSQADEGDETDYLNEMTFQLSRVSFKKEMEISHHLLWNGIKSDEDNISFSPSGNESLTATSEDSSLLLAQEIKKKKQIGFKLSYLRNQRKQSDLGAFTYRQKSDVVEGEIEVKKKYAVTAYGEFYQVYGLEGEDYGLDLSYKNLDHLVKVDVVAGWSKNRDAKLDLNLSVKQFLLFYKKLPPSLFQQTYNDEFGGDSHLKSQELLGFKFKDQFKLTRDLSLKVNLAYYHAQDLVEFLSSSYSNLYLSHNVQASAAVFWRGWGLYLQNQHTKVEDAPIEELPRRPRWTIGLEHQQEVFADFKFYANLKWVSERRAFDDSVLDDFLDSKIGARYKSWQIAVSNVLNQDKPIYKNLKRRPLAFEINYQKVF